MSTHNLIRSDPERPGLYIVDGEYLTVGHLYWLYDRVYVCFGTEETEIQGPMKIQKTYRWLKDRGVDFGESRVFMLSGYIIACEQQETS